MASFDNLYCAGIFAAFEPMAIARDNQPPDWRTPVRMKRRSHRSRTLARPENDGGPMRLNTRERFGNQALRRDGIQCRAECAL
jgi:hypothetical protein